MNSHDSILRPYSQLPAVSVGWRDWSYRDDLFFSDSRCRVREARAKLARFVLSSPELDPYRDAPRQMPAGSIGKSGYLRLDFKQMGEKTVLADMDRRVPFLVQRALYWDEALPEMPCVFVLTTTGSLLQGDRMYLDVHVGDHAQAHVTTQAASKIQMMDANFAALMQEFRVDKGGYLEYLPDAVIPCRHSRYSQLTRLRLAQDACALIGEIVLCGRKHHHADETFGYALYSASTEVFRIETGKRLYTEKQVVEPRRHDPLAIGIMNGFEVFGTMLFAAPPELHRSVCDALGADIDMKRRLAWGSLILPNDAGVLFRVLGDTCEDVRALCRRFWQTARRAATGRDAPMLFFR